MKIGDKISVLDEDLKGSITSVHGDRVVFVDEFGFTHQYYKGQLVIQNAELYDNINVVKEAEPTKIKSKKHNKNHLILDLHFEKLVANPINYKSFERLYIQKEKLTETLEFCRKNNLKALEIIHGVGDGILQKMVYDTLESQIGLDFYNKEILHHQSGSVMVFFIF